MSGAWHGHCNELHQGHFYINSIYIFSLYSYISIWLNFACFIYKQSWLWCYAYSGSRCWILNIHIQIHSLRSCLFFWLGRGGGVQVDTFILGLNYSDFDLTDLDFKLFVCEGTPVWLECFVVNLGKVEAYGWRTSQLGVQPSLLNTYWMWAWKTIIFGSNGFTNITWGELATGGITN